MNMEDILTHLEKELKKDLTTVETMTDLEELEQKFFSRKSGKFTLVSRQVKDISPEKRKQFGERINAVREEMESLLAKKRSEFLEASWKQLASEERIDVTQPALPAHQKGHKHPITQIQETLEDLFTSMGFLIADGPELESEYYNFESVNIPADHPARDMQDTFYIKNHPEWVMRTHTSSVQVRAMQQYGTPLRMIAPGRVFRNEATDARHEHTFYQIEGMAIGPDVNFSHMKGILEAVARHLYGPETAVRLRPKFYPFVEPGVNGEVTCFLCKGAGCRVCKQTGWLEIFGAGMIHPNVLKEGGADPKEIQGCAFGFGLDRLVMLKYGIEDVRHFHSGDLRFLEQF